jgi:hypothetical protein
MEKILLSTTFTQKKNISGSSPHCRSVTLSSGSKKRPSCHFLLNALSSTSTSFQMTMYMLGENAKVPQTDFSKIGGSTIVVPCHDREEESHVDKPTLEPCLHILVIFKRPQEVCSKNVSEESISAGYCSRNQDKRPNTRSPLAVAYLSSNPISEVDSGLTCKAAFDNAWTSPTLEPAPSSRFPSSLSVSRTTMIRILEVNCNSSIQRLLIQQQTRAPLLSTIEPAQEFGDGAVADIRPERPGS